MRASLALTALAMQPSSRRVLLTLSGDKTPPHCCAPRAVGWTPLGDGAPGWTAGAMSEHSCDALPGALPLPHGARPHLTEQCVRSLRRCSVGS